MCNYRLNVIASILTLAFMVNSLPLTEKYKALFLLRWGYINCKRRYAVLNKLLKLEYSTIWKKTIFDLNKFQLASWKPAFSLKTNSFIGGYQRFFITVSAARLIKLWKTFMKTLSFHKIQAFNLCFYWISFYWTNIYRYFCRQRNIHQEVL